MSNKKYRSDVERILTIMLTRCMRADGTIPHYTIIQQVRPTINLEQLTLFLTEAHIEPLTKKTLTREGKYYLASDVLAALELEQKRLDDLTTSANRSTNRRLRSFIDETKDRGFIDESHHVVDVEGEDDDAAGGVA